MKTVFHFLSHTYANWGEPSDSAMDVDHVCAILCVINCQWPGFYWKNKQTNKKKRNKGKIKGNSNMSYSFSRRFSEAIKLSCIHLTLDDDIPHEAYCAVTLFSVALTYFSVTVRVERWGWKLLWKETLFLNKLIIWSVLN